MFLKFYDTVYTDYYFINTNLIVYIHQQACTIKTIDGELYRLTNEDMDKLITFLKNNQNIS